MAMEEFLEECRFFELDGDAIKKMKEVENYTEENRKESIELVQSQTDSDETLQLLTHASGQLNNAVCRDDSYFCLWRGKLWNFFEEPSSSIFASIFAIFSFLLISVSVVLPCALTIPKIQQGRNPDIFKDPWALIELSLNSCFALEYILRLTVCPHFIKFLTSPLNLIDLSAFLPYFIALSINPDKLSSLSLLRMVRMVRVLRLLRLSKQSKKVAVVMDMLKRSVKDISTLVLCYFVSAVVFGSLQYYMELGTPNTPFTSIPQSMWWAFQTVIPLGYGDIVPISTRGKIIGGSVAVLGAITLTVPLLHLGGKFLAEYAETNDIPVGRDVKLENEVEKIKAKKLAKS